MSFLTLEKGTSEYFSKHKIQYMLTEAADPKGPVAYFKRLAEISFSIRSVNYDTGETGEDAMYQTAVIPDASLPGSEKAITSSDAVDYFGVSVAAQPFPTEPAEQMKALLGMGWPKEVVKRRCLPRIQTLIALGHPLGALKWATAKGAQGKDFQILVHAKNDIVSHHLLTTGFWEGDHLGAAEAFHLRTQNGKAPSPRRYIDIGANLGYFTLLAASRGYEVTALEAMQKNAAIQNVSLCANPKLEQLVTLRNVGLADKPGKCFIVSDNKNQADGIMRCDIKKREDFKKEGYQIRGEIKLETMNTIVKGDYFMMKIDIEGAEPLALSEKGTSEYFSKHKIQYMLTEAADPKGRVAYFKRLAEIGFSIRSVNYDTGETGEDAMYQTAVIPDASLPGSEKAITSSDAVDYFGVMRAPAEGFPLQNALQYPGPGESKAKA